MRYCVGVIMCHERISVYVCGTCSSASSAPRVEACTMRYCVGVIMCHESVYVVCVVPVVVLLVRLA